jgi:hypothetical protein
MKAENVSVFIRKMIASGEVIQPRVVRCANLSQTSGLSPLYRTPVILAISITLINTVIRIIGVYIDWHGLAGPVTSWMASAFGGISVVPIPAPSGPIVDPLQTWGRGSATPYAEHRSNLNVINISAKKSEH